MRTFVLFLFFTLNLVAQKRVSEIIHYKVKYGETEESLNWKMEFQYDSEKLMEIKTSSQNYPIFTPLSYEFTYEKTSILGKSKEGEINFKLESNENKPIRILNKYFGIDLKLTYDKNGNVKSILYNPIKGKESYTELWFYDYVDGNLSQVQYGNVSKFKKPKRKHIKNEPIQYKYENDKIVEIKSVPRDYQFEYNENEKTIVYDNSIKTVYSYQNGRILDIKKFRKEDETYKLKARTKYIYENKTGNENFFLDYLNAKLFLTTLQPTDGRIIE